MVRYGQIHFARDFEFLHEYCYITNSIIPFHLFLRSFRNHEESKHEKLDLFIYSAITFYFTHCRYEPKQH
jgi:hypothetical protein